MKQHYAIGISKGVKIEVISLFDIKNSCPERNLFLYLYNITITNQTDLRLKLLRRKWNIYDSCGTKRVVQGEGVVGLQPIFQPDEDFSYSSSCDLRTEIGSMKGHYYFLSYADNQIIEVDIPEFKLEAVHKFN